MRSSVTATNLSYVLHEPSGSSEVRTYAERIAHTERRLGRAVERLQHLSDRDLLARLVQLPVDGASLAGAGIIVTARLGAWPLLARVVDALGAEVEICSLDAGETKPLTTVSFFRADASLNLPDPRSINARPLWFAALVVRPGDATLLLEARPIVSSGAGGMPRQAIAYAESAIRAHVEQWFCDRQLWTSPAEFVLPELRASD